MTDKIMSDRIRRFAEEAVRIQSNNENKLRYVLSMMRELKDAKNTGNDEKIADVVKQWDVTSLVNDLEIVLCEK